MQQSKLIEFLKAVSEADEKPHRGRPLLIDTQRLDYPRSKKFAKFQVSQHGQNHGDFANKFEISMETYGRILERNPLCPAWREEREGRVVYHVVFMGREFVAREHAGRRISYDPKERSG